MPVGRSTDISTTTIKRRAIMLHPPPVRFSTPPAAEGKRLSGPAVVMVTGLGNLTSCQLVKATTDQLMRTGKGHLYKDFPLANFTEHKGLERLWKLLWVYPQL